MSMGGEFSITMSKIYSRSPKMNEPVTWPIWAGS